MNNAPGLDVKKSGLIFASEHIYTFFETYTNLGDFTRIGNSQNF